MADPRTEGGKKQEEEKGMKASKMMKTFRMIKEEVAEGFMVKLFCDFRGMINPSCV